MGYHDRQPVHLRTLSKKATADHKLKIIQEILDNISDQTALTAFDLKTKIENAIKEKT